MKFLRSLIESDPTRQDLLIRVSSSGRKLTAEEISLVLAKEFGVNASSEELQRYVEPFNRYLQQEVNPESPNQKETTRKIWQKLASELAHPVKRNR